MKIHQVIPSAGLVSVSELVAHLAARRHDTNRPFSPETLKFCSDFSSALFADIEARRFPEIQALAFWMRKARLARLQSELAALALAGTVPVPCGLVFHIPPANVDTIFIYSWLLSFLAGNRNIIRLPANASEQTEIIVRILSQVLRGQDDRIAQNTTIVRYGHEREVTEAISSIADMRVIWGGDESVRAIRSVPLLPHAAELTFPDRYSFSAIAALAYLRLEPEARTSLAGLFYNDLFWFDQMACSSPRLMVWCGEPDICREASHDFYRELAGHILKKGYSSGAGGPVRKLTFACQAILDDRVSSRAVYGHELSVLGIDELSSFRRTSCGGGVLFQFHARALEELAGFVDRCDQTLTYFGFAPAELGNLAGLLNGRGLDRIVPIGQALTFGRFWDGYDLLQAFTRRVHIEGEVVAAAPVGNSPVPQASRMPE